MQCYLLVVVILMNWMSPRPHFAASQRIIGPDTIKESLQNGIRKEIQDHVNSKLTTPDCTDGRTETINHQVWLFTNYRGLWQYRTTTHSYDSLEPKDSKDSPNNFGSVIFINFQNLTLYLNCPCGKGTWKMYGRGSNTFNAEPPSATQRLKVRAPPQRFYYRTYSCNSGSDTHYFNVFTRPLGLTSLPPLMFTEKIKGPADSVNMISCQLTMYQTLKDKPSKYNYIAIPFQFYWQFPSHEDYAKQTAERLHDNRPPIDTGTDNFYWGEQSLRGGSSIPGHLPDDKLFKIMKIPEVANDGICPQRNKTGNTVTLGSELVISKKATPEHAGLYACVAVDGNGLSSAFWWDGDYPPHTHFRGFAHIRVRALKYIYMAVGILVGLVIIVALLIVILPDNKEDFTADPIVEAPATATDTMEEPPAMEQKEPTLRAPPSVNTVAVAVHVEEPIQPVVAMAEEVHLTTVTEKPKSKASILKAKKKH